MINRVFLDVPATWYNSTGGWTIEEYEENGHMAPIPYIRVTDPEGNMVEFSKDKCVVYKSK